jgi:hypothetical protein
MDSMSAVMDCMKGVVLMASANLDPGLIFDAIRKKAVGLIFCKTERTEPGPASGNQKKMRDNSPHSSRRLRNFHDSKGIGAALQEKSAFKSRRKAPARFSQPFFSQGVMPVRAGGL